MEDCNVAEVFSQSGLFEPHKDLRDEHAGKLGYD